MQNDQTPGNLSEEQAINNPRQEGSNNSVEESALSGENINEDEKVGQQNIGSDASEPVEEGNDTDDTDSADISKTNLGNTEQSSWQPSQIL